jgi:hypothetical protein
MSVINVAAAGLLLFGLGPVEQQLEYQELGKHATIRAKRPIEVLADQIQRRYGIPVNYEDIRTLAPGDIVDETAAVAKASNPTARALGRREGHIEIQLEEPTADRVARRQQAERIVGAALLEHERTGNNGLFSVVGDANFISIVPKSSRGRDGRMAEDRSPLDTLISLESQPATGLDCVHGLVRAIQENGAVRVQIGLMPENYLRQISGNCSAKKEPARDVLERALYFPRIDGVYGALDRGQRIAFVWRLLYDIQDESYTLSIVPASQLVESRFGGHDLREILVEMPAGR